MESGREALAVERAGGSTACCGPTTDAQAAESHRAECRTAARAFIQLYTWTAAQRRDVVFESVGEGSHRGERSGGSRRGRRELRVESVVLMARGCCPSVSV